MNNTINKEKLLKRINSMESICSDGRREIKGLIEELIGEPLEKPVIDSINAGDVVEHPNGEIGLLVEVGSELFLLHKNCGFVKESVMATRRGREERLKYYQEVGVKKIGKARIVIDPI